MLKKTLSKLTVITATAAFAIATVGCEDSVPEDANDDGGEGEGEFEMGDEPNGEGGGEGDGGN